MHGRQIDGNWNRRHALLLPADVLAAGFLHYPISQRDDQATLFRNPNKVERPDQAARRMLPADQGLSASDVSASQVHLRLVIQHKLVFFQGAAQIALDQQHVQCALIHARCMESVAFAPFLLGMRERHVSGAQ